MSDTHKIIRYRSGFPTESVAIFQPPGANALPVAIMLPLDETARTARITELAADYALIGARAFDNAGAAYLQRTMRGGDSRAHHQAIVERYASAWECEVVQLAPRDA